MLLLVGLGNPGARHVGNRHNIGFLAVQEIAKRHGLGPWRRRFAGDAGKAPASPAKDRSAACDRFCYCPAPT
jgi:PTH1 family peptidyl-tRNA hydrolase